MSEVLKNAVSTISNYWYNEKDSCVLAQNKEILEIGNILNSLLIDRQTIEIPRLVVVGSQSSGKSTLLNSILGMDILPTGNNMVTRSPLQIELIQCGSTSVTKGIFGKYIEGKWQNLYEIDLDYPNTSDEQKKSICDKIEDITRENAGNNMNISFLPIYLRIYSPNVPNLSLVDLPGLTMVACTDKGQPKDIKDQIKRMIGEYIKPTKTIILAVMPARTDIEADIALDLIKEYDPKGIRTVGILTKLDLMNEGTDITNLLENKVSVDLQLKYGYYGIRNRTKQETSEFNVIEGLEIEQKYFYNHRIYSNNKYKDNLGIPSLCKNLSNILVNSIKSCLPKILSEINQNIADNNIKLEKLGKPLPEDEQAKSAYIHHLLSKFCRKFISTLEDRGKNINSGRNIKDLFIGYRNDLFNIDPFSEENCSDLYIEESIRNCEGNHMSFPSPPIEVLEQIMKDEHKKPINKLYEPSKVCADNVMNELVVLTNILLDDIGIIRFPLFSKIIKTELLNNLLIDNLNCTLKKILELIEMQQNYLWTDDINFIELLSNNSDNNLQVKLMRKLLNFYYTHVIHCLQDSIPKCIMLFLVKKTEDCLSTNLYEKIKNENVEKVLLEYDDIHSQRMDIEKSNRELYNARKLIESL